VFNPEATVRLGIILAFPILTSSLYWRTGVRLGRLHRRLYKTLWAVVSMVLGITTLFCLLFMYVYYGFGYQPDIYRHGNRQSNKVAITFDDGPSDEFTLPILAILQEYNVPATFFMVGKHVEKYPEVAQRVAAEGHTIGSHTQSHRRLPALSTLDLHQEMMEATAVITEITGVYPTFFRPPQGMYDGRSRRLSQLLGQTVVLWSISTHDWRYGVSAKHIVDQISSKVKGGDIILFHDSGALIKSEGGNRWATVEALPAAIEAIRAKGLEIVPLAELLEKSL